MAVALGDEGSATRPVPLMEWFGSYIGLPFQSKGRDRSGLDCWGLVRLVFAEQRKIDLPSYGEISAFDLARVSREIGAALSDSGWRTCAPKPFACAVMTAGQADRRLHKAPFHIGVYVDETRILHVEPATDAVVVRANHPSISRRILGCYEYATG